MKLLVVENLSAGYGSCEILHGVSFEVGEGEIFGIIGPNGSGKSTLIRALMRLVAYRGTVLYKGEDIATFSPQKLARTIAVVSQSPSRPPMDVFSYLMMGRYPYHKVWEFGISAEEKALIVRLAKEFGVDSLFPRRLSDLSGGEFQMVQIVRALVQQPRLLLMDEPTAHLDIQHQVRILDWLETIKHRITVIIVLHDINLASLYCDTIMLLSQGRVEIVEKPEKAITYEKIEHVFRVPVVVYPSPLSKKPHAYLVPARLLKGDGCG